ncbi:MAG TPA: hypothetical protein V6D12_13415 [Candidatus Obscuribacterales bacterium]
MGKIHSISIEYTPVTMKIQLCPLQSAISELFAQASHSGRITLADQYGLLAALLYDSLNVEERRAIDRLLYAVRKGRIKVVDEISVIQ